MDLQNEAKLRTASATGKRIFAAKDKLNKFFPNFSSLTKKATIKFTNIYNIKKFFKTVKNYIPYKRKLTIN